MRWHVWSDRDRNEPAVVENYNKYNYTCSCADWQLRNDRFNPRAKPGWCRHIRSMNGSKVTVKFRKYGQTVRIE